ncbi:hypothetical protein GCM10022262_34180 [Georgenia daeguensis]|uniref:Uncharacterized protein n=1 Tax=Georgenia daeguensis TaxID=908355 RepID=A0ABP8EZ08_9MICO
MEDERGSAEMESGMLPQGGPLSSRFEEICPGCHGTGRQPRDPGPGRRVPARTEVTPGPCDDQAGPPLALVFIETDGDQQRRRCSRCGGAGTVPTRAGDELLAFLRRHLPYQHGQGWGSSTR